MRGDVDVFYSYLDWFCDNSDIKHRDSLSVAWKSLCRVRRRQGGEDLPRQVYNKIKEVSVPTDRVSSIADLSPQCLSQTGILVTDHDLVLTRKDKPVMHIDDFWHLLATLWRSSWCAFRVGRGRLQLHLYFLLAGYPASRPGALLGTRQDGTLRRTLVYRHTKLSLLRNPCPSERDVFVLQVTYYHTKGNTGMVKP